MYIYLLCLRFRYTCNSSLYIRQLFGHFCRFLHRLIFLKHSCTVPIRLEVARLVFTGGVQCGAGVYPRRAELTTTAAGVPPLRKSYAALRISQWAPCASEAYQPRLIVRVRTKECVSPFARAQVMLTQPSQLARVHTLITMAGLFSPPLRKSIRP